MTNKKGDRRNFMSYMVVIKNVNGIVMASDSYSTYPDRTLKDSNYKKIHCLIPNVLCVGITGINQVYVGKELVDINGTLLEYFRAVSDKNIADIVKKYSEFLKITCDREYKDMRLMVAYKKTLYRVDIMHNNKPFIEFYKENELDIITSGEEEHIVSGLRDFTCSDMFSSLEEALKTCIQSVKNEILLEKNLYPKNQRAVGGKVQYVVIDYSKFKRPSKNSRFMSEADVPSSSLKIISNDIFTYIFDN